LGDTIPLQTLANDAVFSLRLGDEAPIPGAWLRRKVAGFGLARM